MLRRASKCLVSGVYKKELKLFGRETHEGENMIVVALYPSEGSEKFSFDDNEEKATISFLQTFKLQ